MQKMLELEVLPEKSLGCQSWEFILGMHFSQAVSVIQSQIGIIKGVHVLYSESDPLNFDLILDLTHDGIRLLFHPVSQRLKVIEVYNMKLVKLKYCNIVFNSQEVVPTVEQIENSFGATHPGMYDREKQLFVLNFRGLTFYFPAESNYQPDYALGLGSLQFPSGSSPVLTCMAIYDGNNPSETMPPDMPVCVYMNNIYLKKLEVIREPLKTTGVRLHLYSEGPSRYFELKSKSMVKEVYFGDTCQSVLSSLGTPSRVYYKSEDKMKIHSPNSNKKPSDTHSDYFYNYFTLGLDILFDSKTQLVKKFVLHTNYPGHYNFNMYHRCEFELVLPHDSCDNSKKLINIPCQTVTITSLSQWDAVAEQINPSARPVVLNRSSSTNTTNPFGSTFCYGYQDIIFEVMPNSHIASVTLHSEVE
ncbi:PHAF1 protein CG7083 [Cloeon dipterum]|uniref:PHAF1 protein CG7083 n=1 Tax=Cloeon dipterum TaxID=197152 RepID=UPI00321FD88E